MRQSITDDRYADGGHVPEPYDDRLIVTDFGYVYGDYEIREPSDSVMAANYAHMFVHVDYDGAEDARDNRIGYANTLEEVREMLDKIEAA